MFIHLSFSEKKGKYSLKTDIYYMQYMQVACCKQKTLIYSITSYQYKYHQSTASNVITLLSLLSYVFLCHKKVKLYKYTNIKYICQLNFRIFLNTFPDSMLFTSLVLQMSLSVDPQALPGFAFHGMIPENYYMYYIHPSKNV